MGFRIYKKFWALPILKKKSKIKILLEGGGGGIFFKTILDFV